MRVLVTGAGGFVGGHIANRLQAQAHEVTGTIRRTKAEGNFSVERCDLSKAWNIDGEFDVIVHTAGSLPYRDKAFESFYLNNVVVMQNLIRFALGHGIKRIVYLSTIGVHGEIRDAVLTEESDKINPDPYGLTKYVAECMLRAENRLQSISLRLPGIIGEGCRGVWLSNVVEKFLKHETVEIYSPDFKTKNFVWIDDLSCFIGRLLETDDWRYDLINVACSRSNAIRELVSEIKHLTKSKSQIIINDGIRKSFCIDASRAIEMGYESLTPLEIVEKYCETVMR